MIIGISGKIGSGKDTVGQIIQYLVSINKDRPSGGIWTFDSYINTSNWEIKKFAGKLKEVVSLLTGYSLEDLEKQKIKDTILGEEWWYYKIPNQDGSYSIRSIKDGGNYAKDNYKVFKPTIRDLLQIIGTDLMRNQLHSNVWVNALLSDYHPVTKFRWAKSIGDLHYGNGSTTFCGKPMLGNNYASYLIEGERNICPDCYNKSLPNWIITDVRFENEAQAILDKSGILIRISKPASLMTNKELHESEIALDNYKGFKYHIQNDGSIEDLIKSVRQILLSEKIL